MDNQIIGKSMEQAQEMAEAFAKDKTEVFLETFLKETGLAEELHSLIMADLGANAQPLPDFTKALIGEHKFTFGRALAIAYAHGYMDKAEGRHIKKVISSLKPVVKF